MKHDSEKELRQRCLSGKEMRKAEISQVKALQADPCQLHRTLAVLEAWDRTCTYALRTCTYAGCCWSQRGVGTSVSAADRARGFVIHRHISTCYNRAESNTNTNRKQMPFISFTLQNILTTSSSLKSILGATDM